MTGRKNLTDKQQRFVQEYIIDWNATQACIRAGYSKKNADRIGPELLTHPKVSEEIKKHSKKISAKAEIDAVWVLKRNAEMLEADIADIIDDDGSYKPIKEWPKIWRQMLQGVDIKEVFDGFGKERQKVGEVVKIKFIDRLKALELIGKHVNVQAFSDNVTVEVVDKSSILEAARERAAESIRNRTH